MVFRNRMFMRLGAALAACLLFAGAARAVAIRELANLAEALPIQVEGVGIIAGLAGTGDKGKAAHEMLLKYLSNANFDFEPGTIEMGSLALVSVSAEIPPFSPVGNKIPVRVTAFNNAKSLYGGVLLRTELFIPATDRRPGINERDILAIASGRVVVGSGHLTSGEIAAGVNGGATVTLPHKFGKILDKDWSFRLSLKNPNHADAASIARQINQTPALNPYLRETTMFAEPEPSRPVAIALDEGHVLVFFPEPFQGRISINDYLAILFDVPVPVSHPARIIINKAKNVIVVHGDVRVSGSATVSLQDKTVTLRPATAELPAGYVLENNQPRIVVETEGPGASADLQGLIDTLNAMGLSTEQVIVAFEQLASVGAIRANIQIQ